MFCDFKCRGVFTKDFSGCGLNLCIQYSQMDLHRSGKSSPYSTPTGQPCPISHAPLHMFPARIASETQPTRCLHQRAKQHSI